MKKIKDNKTLLFENMVKLNPDFKLIIDEEFNFNTFYQQSEYEKKTNEIKEKIDELLEDNEYDSIDAIYGLLVKRTKLSKQTSLEELKEIFEKHGQ